jgi:hypothetical protein
MSDFDLLRLAWSKLFLGGLWFPTPFKRQRIVLPDWWKVIKAPPGLDANFR